MVKDELSICLSVVMDKMDNNMLNIEISNWGKIAKQLVFNIGYFQDMFCE